MTVFCITVHVSGVLPVVSHCDMYEFECQAKLGMEGLMSMDWYFVHLIMQMNLSAIARLMAVMILGKGTARAASSTCGPCDCVTIRDSSTSR